jgi:predicted RNA-binding Zn-ribbon protein involved in translation (DUF1610 family)
MNQTHYTKLKSGDWGLWIPGHAAVEGAAITVTTKAGKVRKETIGKILHKGTNDDGQAFSLCSIVKKPKNGEPDQPAAQAAASSAAPQQTTNQRIRPSGATTTKHSSFICPHCGEALEVRKQ